MSKETFGYLGTSTLPECTDYRDLLKKSGWVYILTSGGPEAWGQTIHAFAQPIPDDQVAAIIRKED